MSKVQCFYNVNYNHGHPDGQSKFQWGFGWFELLGDCVPLTDQIKDKIVDGDTNAADIYNLNLTAFTPFHDEVFEED